jgi:tRNA dimethylallyltransferase
MSSDLICILGPTASGKTKFAVRLAFENGGEIISADSRQVYRGMDIGTGKDLAEYIYNGVQIPYHLIDIAEPGSKYNIFEYQRDFHNAYNDIRTRGKLPILCGGSGLYIETAVNGYSLPEVPPDPELRGELEAMETEELVKRLSSMKQLHNTTDTDSRKRLIRALEIAIYQEKISGDSAGNPVDGRNPANRVAYTSYPPIKTRFIGIDVSREVRIARIDKRLKERLEGGMIEEVKGLLDRGIPADDLIYYGLEYKFVTLYLTGTLTYGQMESQIATAIHQFAKRQMTWFRGMERRGIKIEWVTPESVVNLG